MQEPMASSTPASNPKEQASAKAAPPAGLMRLWRGWWSPIVVVTIIIALATALFMGAVTVFQSVKSDVTAAEARFTEANQASEARLMERIQAAEARFTEVNQATETRLMERIQATEASFTEALQASEDRLHEEIQATEARLHEEIQATEVSLNKRIDEVRADFKAEIKDVKAEIRDLKVEMKQNNAEMRTELRSMGDKLDQVLETLLAAKA